jgi:hypothetical protein
VTRGTTRILACRPQVELRPLRGLHNRKWHGMCGMPGHINTGPTSRFQHAFGKEIVERGDHGVAGDAEFRGQIPCRGQPDPMRESPTRNRLPDRVLHRPSFRQRRIQSENVVHWTKILRALWTFLMIQPRPKVVIISTKGHSFAHLRRRRHRRPRRCPRP